MRIDSATARLWALHVAGNAALIWLIYEWLGIRDARLTQIAATVALGLAIVLIALWLHASTFTFYRERVFRTSRAYFAKFAAVVAVFLLIWWALERLDAPAHKAAQWTASWLTFHLRRPVSPVWMGRIFGAALWIVNWIVAPVALLPVAAGASPRAALRPRFWLVYAAILLVGFYAPYRLMFWAPALGNAAAEFASFAFRWLLAWALMNSAWMALVFFSSGNAETAR